EVALEGVAEGLGGSRRRREREHEGAHDGKGSKRHVGLSQQGRGQGRPTQRGILAELAPLVQPWRARRQDSAADRRWRGLCDASLQLPRQGGMVEIASERDRCLGRSTTVKTTRVGQEEAAGCFELV